MTTPRATWVLWCRWRNLGWATECSVSPGQVSGSARDYVQIIATILCDRREWMRTGGNYRILPAGRVPK